MLEYMRTEEMVEFLAGAVLLALSAHKAMKGEQKKYHHAVPAEKQRR